jgi:MFS family permease
VNEIGFKKRHLVVPVFIPSMLFSAGEGAILPILPSTAISLGASLPMAGFISGLTMIGTVAFDVPAARLVQKYGERRSMLVSSFIAATALILAAFATNIWVLGAEVFVAGAMISTFALARHAFMAEHVPITHRARSLSLLGGMFRAGGFIGPVVASAVVFAVGSTWVFVAGALLCASAGIVLLAAPSDRVPDSTGGQHGSAFAVAKQEWRKLATVGMAATILGMLRTVRQLGLPLWGIFIGLHPGTVSLFIGVAGFLDFLLFYASGQIMDRYGRRWALLPTLIGLAISHAALIFAHTSVGFLVVAVLMSLANALGSGIVLTLGADLAPPKTRHEFLAAYRLLVDSGVALTPVLLSGLTVAVTLPGAMIGFAGLSLIGAFLGWRGLPKFGIR